MSSCDEELTAAIRNLEKAFASVWEMKTYAEFLQKTLLELTTMTPQEIRVSWRIYLESHRPQPE